MVKSFIFANIKLVNYSYKPEEFILAHLDQSCIFNMFLKHLCFPLQNAAATVMVQGMAASAVTRNPASVHVRTIYTNKHALSAKMVSSPFQQQSILIVSSVIVTMVEA